MIPLFGAALFLMLQTQPAFEVATIKTLAPAESGQPAPSIIACHGRDAGSPQVPLGRCIVTRRPLIDVIAWAYGVQRTLIIGGPDWLTASRFDIEGKAEDPSIATYADLRSMFQKLMADRFKLTFHRDTRQVDGYALVVAKGGLKLKEAAADEQTDAMQSFSSVTYKSSTVGRLVQFLGSFILGRPVVDETGLTGKYDMALSWTPTNLQTYVENPEVLQGPSIFSALQEQLGLRLVSRKVPAEALIIDRAELPSRDGRR
jgi:uncharacterized protein (TIGR03435 family)